MLHGVDPENRMQILDIVAQFTELLRNGHDLPPKKEMADIFLDRDMDEDGNEISVEQHIEALTELFVETMIMLAEEKADLQGEGYEIHMLMNGEAGPDHVAIKIDGFKDPRYVVAALAQLESKGYLQQLWNIAVNGKVDPHGPQVFFQDHTIKKKEESA
jgi:hypothetical protein